MTRVKSVFLHNGSCRDGQSLIDYVYAQGRFEQVAVLTDLYPVIITPENLDEHARHLSEVEVAFSTWGMPLLDSDQLACLPSLKALFYAAGSVKGFASPLLERGITVVSAWSANAVSVAEFCQCQILLACKGFFRNTRDCRNPQVRIGGRPFYGKGAYGEKIALIGGGQIGRRLIGLLQPFQVEILLVDPYVSDSEAQELGVRKVELEQAFQEAYVVSNHLPNLPELRQVLDGTLFRQMRPDATFINTGRGAQINEADLIEVLEERPDLTVLLDVTDPEPPEPRSKFYTLPNVQMTSHIAGAHDDEVVRMADFMIAEFQRWQCQKPLLYQVTSEMLPTMA